MTKKKKGSKILDAEMTLFVETVIDELFDPMNVSDSLVFFEF